MGPDSTSLVTVPQTRVEDFATNVALPNITIETVKSKHIKWLTVSIAVKKGTLPESVQPMKRVCTEWEVPALAVDQFDTL